MGKEQQHTVEFRLCRNLIIVEAMVNGQSYPLVLDTGASHTVLNHWVVEALGLASGESKVGQGALCALPATMTSVASLQVGGATITDQQVVYADLDAVQEKVGERIGGVLGYDFLSRYRLTIDYEDRRLTLAPYAG